MEVNITISEELLIYLSIILAGIILTIISYRFIRKKKTKLEEPIERKLKPKKNTFDEVKSFPSADVQTRIDVNNNNESTKADVTVPFLHVSKRTIHYNIRPKKENYNETHIPSNENLAAPINRNRILSDEKGFNSTPVIRRYVRTSSQCRNTTGFCNDSRGSYTSSSNNPATFNSNFNHSLSERNGFNSAPISRQQKRTSFQNESGANGGFNFVPENNTNSTSTINGKSGFNNNDKEIEFETPRNRFVRNNDDNKKNAVTSFDNVAAGSVPKNTHSISSGTIDLHSNNSSSCQEAPVSRKQKNNQNKEQDRGNSKNLRSPFGNEVEQTPISQKTSTEDAMKPRKDEFLYDNVPIKSRASRKLEQAQDEGLKVPSFIFETKKIKIDNSDPWDGNTNSKMNNTQEDIQDLAEFIEPFNPYGPKKSQLIGPIKTDNAVDESRDNDAPKPRTMRYNGRGRGFGRNGGF